MAEITKKDYEGVIERYLYHKHLNEEDIKILKESPFCTCDVLNENPGLAQRFQEQLKSMVKSFKSKLTDIGDYIAFDVEVTREWYHPEFEGYVPTLPNVLFTQTWDGEGNLHILDESPYQIEKYLLDNGYEFIRTDYNKAYYYKKKH